LVIRADPGLVMLVIRGDPRLGTSRRSAARAVKKDPRRSAARQVKKISAKSAARDEKIRANPRLVTSRRSAQTRGA